METNNVVVREGHTWRDREGRQLRVVAVSRTGWVAAVYVRSAIHVEMQLATFTDGRYTLEPAS